MARDDDDFRLRPGKIRDQSGERPGGRRVRGVRARPTSFTGQIQQAIRRAGGDPSRLNGTGKGSGRFNARGRGTAVAAALKNRSPWSRDGGIRTRARRVAVKARVVKLNPQRGAARGRAFVSAKAVDAHLRYLQRDGVTKDGEKGQVYSAERDVEDGRAFVVRGREDRHQFRFIVSAEDGVELADPRATTRDLMKQMEADLGTKLDWIAVDHHNTGHPHTHIIVRGVTDDGKTLNIAGDYIAHGIRERASEVVTRELGRQTEQEVARSLEREVDADRFTRLDRMLIAEQRSRNEFADLRPDRDMLDSLRQNRALLIQRARKLERMGLATEVEVGRWSLSPRAETDLRELGERGDIIKAMHRALTREGLAEARPISAYVLHGEKTTEPIVGRVLDKGLGGDEMGERVRLVIDGVDGRVHHLEMDPARAEEVQRGMIVAAERRADRPARRGPQYPGDCREGGRLSSGRASGIRPSAPSSVWVAIPLLTSVPMSVGWRRYAAPAMSSGSTPTSGASRSIFRSAGRPTIAPGTGRTAASGFFRPWAWSSRPATTAPPGLTASWRPGSAPSWPMRGSAERWRRPWIGAGDG